MTAAAREIEGGVRRKEGGERARRTAQSESLFIFQRKIAACLNSDGYQNTTEEERERRGPFESVYLQSREKVLVRGCEKFLPALA